MGIVLVVAYHVVGRHSGFAGRGFALFFAISGFLITTLLLREQAAQGHIAVGRFYARRALRMFPLYYAMLGVYVIAVVLFEREPVVKADFFRNLPTFLTYTSNWFVRPQGDKRIIFYFAWSLAAEQQFYSMWPVMVGRLRGRTPVLVTLVLLGIALWAPWAVDAGRLDGSALGVRILTSLAAPIWMGCLAAYALHSPIGFAWLHRFLGGPWSAVLVFLGAALAITVPATPGWLIGLAMAALVVATCIGTEHRLLPFLTFAPVRYLGRVSYGICLMHMLVLNLLRRVAPRLEFVRLFAFTLAVSVVMAGLSHRYFESRFLALKKRFSATASTGRPAAAPVVPADAERTAHRFEPVSPAAGSG